MGGADRSAAAYFSESYDEARRRFRRAAAAQGFDLIAEPLPPAPQDAPEETEQTEPPTLDVAFCGPRQARECVVFSSGLHGVEGYFGGAVQLALLADPELLQALEGRRVVLMHALNPFGMRRDRRWNENGVDLNRNFLPEGAAYDGAPPEYGLLDPVLNPTTPPPLIDPFPLSALKAMARHRFRTLKIALSAGQYAYPEGLWYGGAGPEALRGALERGLDHWIGAAARLTWFDLHTGLGGWGAHRLFVSPELAEDRLADLRARYGAETVVTLFDGMQAMPNKGLMRDWLSARYADRDAAIMTAEFGTYPPLAVAQALRAENRAWRFVRGSWTHRRCARRLREIFAPKSRAWRERTVAAAVDLARRTL